MGNVIQLVPALVGIVVAVILLVALLQLIAIRKSLETLVRQRQMPVRQPRFEEAPEQVLPASRPVIVSPPPPPPAPLRQPRFEEAPERVQPASRPVIVSPPPPPPEPLQHTAFGEAPEQFVLTEEVAEPAQPGEEVPQQPPAYRPATVSSPPPEPAQPKTSHMATIIGIVVLVFAVGFLIFMIVYTK